MTTTDKSQNTQNMIKSPNLPNSSEDRLEWIEIAHKLRNGGPKFLLPCIASVFLPYFIAAFGDIVLLVCSFCCGWLWLALYGQWSLLFFSPFQGDYSFIVQSCATRWLVCSFCCCELLFAQKKYFSSWMIFWYFDSFWLLFVISA